MAKANKAIFFGTFSIALCTLMYELLLTRIFSVTMYYHFSFLVLSGAMFGISIGGMLVFTYRDWFAKKNLLTICAICSIGFAVSTLLATLIHINIQVVNSYGMMLPFNLLLTYAAISLPFLFGGIFLSYIFTNYAEQFNVLYGADLFGASLGCLGVLLALKYIDAVSAIVLVSLLASATGLVIALVAKEKRLIIGTACLSIILAIALSINVKGYLEQDPFMHLLWAKGTRVDHPLYERWNSFSWIAVSGNEKIASQFFLPGVSKAVKPSYSMRGLDLDIDGSARTNLIGWEPNPDRLGVFKYDVTNIAYHLEKDPSVLIIGTGGGKDVISALLFGAKHVTGIEINENTLRALNVQFGQFTGHLDKNPKVTFINDEARSYISRHGQDYDVIQMPFIDTWAATSNGAYVLAESALYTVEGWKVFLSHLTDNGIFTVARWFAPGRGEVLRMLALTTQALKELGIADTRSHIVLVKNLPINYPDIVGVGTLLVSKKPFSAEELETIDNICKKLKWEIVVSPNYAEDDLVAKLASGESVSKMTENIPINISPSTDDGPFFFNMLKPTHIFDPSLKSYLYDANIHAVKALIGTLLISIATAAITIWLPLRFNRKPVLHKETVIPLGVFFLLIGINYMLVEIALIHKLIVFLGHPVYGISVVLFFLLLSSALGSYCSKGLAVLFKSGWLQLVPIIAALIIIGLLVPFTTAYFAQSETLVRILFSAALVSCVGFFLGIAFPVGLRIARLDSQELTPWYWGINGAGSVIGAALAVIVSISYGITVLYLAAMFGYILTVLVLALAEKRLTHTVIGSEVS